MNRPCIAICLFSLLISSPLLADEVKNKERETVRELQALDRSQLDFDFFEEETDNPSESDEASLLQALELLEQSAELHVDNNELLDNQETHQGLLNEDDLMPSIMDEEVETNLDQDINQELLDVLEDEFYEE